MLKALRHVAYSPELPNIQTFLTPKELLNLISHELFFPDGTNTKSEIDQVIELVGLHDYAETKVGKLSKGMIQRLSVAQALIGSPETLILDEPMISLDPAGVAHFRDVFRDFASHGKGTVFMSSHIMSEVESLCTSVAMIHHGKILFKGPVEEVVEKVLDYSLVELETSPLTPQTMQQLKEISGISQINILDNGKRDAIAIEITVCERDHDIRPEIADIVVKSGAKLYTIKPCENMLERAYIEALKEPKGAKL